MTVETDDDLFASLPEPEVDAAPAEPTAEEAFSKEFDAGLDTVLGNEDIAPQESVKTLIAGMSEDEVKALLDKARKVDDLEDRFTKLHDKAFGTIGNLKQTVDELRNRPVSAGKPNVSKETFKKLSAYFDDEGIAEALAGDLEGMEFGGGTDNSAVDERLAQIEQKMETRLLDFAHPDWREVSQAPEFSEWQQTLKPEAQELLANSWDGAELAKAFSTFKSWRDKRTQAEQSKQQRLEQGIMPGGTGRSASSAADDAFNQGLKKVVAQRTR